MIERKQATVYFSSAANRRYFSKDAAINAEVRARILAKHPITPYETDTGEGYDIRIHEPERYKKMHRRLKRLVKQQEVSV